MPCFDRTVLYVAVRSTCGVIVDCWVEQKCGRCPNRIYPCPLTQQHLPFLLCILCSTHSSLPSPCWPTHPLQEALALAKLQKQAAKEAKAHAKKQAKMNAKLKGWESRLSVDSGAPPSSQPTQRTSESPPSAASHERQQPSSSPSSSSSSAKVANGSEHSTAG